MKMCIIYVYIKNHDKAKKKITKAYGTCNQNAKFISTV